jgi:hypothetical protein
MCYTHLLAPFPTSSAVCWGPGLSQHSTADTAGAVNHQLTSAQTQQAGKQLKSSMVVKGPCAHVAEA